MSLIALAEAIDRLVEAKQAYIAESESAATVSALSPTHASELLIACESLGWGAELFDRADELWASAEPPDINFAPFRLVIHKPTAPANTLRLLSNHAFAQWLARGHVAPRWYVARFAGPLVTGTRIIQSWDGIQEPAEQAPTKSPRTLVKEFGNIRRVPEDVRCWLTSSLSAEFFAQSATQVWVHAASTALMSCLPDELDADSGALKFRGPPRLTLPGFEATDALDHETFNILLDVARWVFEHERESEIRHILLAAELARSGAATEGAPAFLSQHLAHAWESAQIAYQMALAETGRDTLKALSDLRKDVTEETNKLSDISRQLIGSVAAAVATGIGLIAARVAANAPAGLIAVVMLVVALYIAMVIFSGVQFMRLQRQLRVDWQPRLYRFLPEAEYDRMVEAPTKKAEHSFTCAAWLGGAAVAALTVTCILVVLMPTITKLFSSDVPAAHTTVLAPPHSHPAKASSPSPAKSAPATGAPVTPGISTASPSRLKHK